MIGAGLFAAGIGPFGTGTPDVVGPEGGSIFRDPSTGAQLTSRMIDPVTGDYVTDENGRILGMTEGQQAVLLAMKTELGTSALVTLGQQLTQIRTISDSFTREVQDKVRSALAPSVAAGLISRVTTTVTSNGSRGFAVVRWFDETTQTEQTLTL